MILVVDDNQLIASNIVEYLQIQWIPAIACFDGETAFEMIQKKLDANEKIELIILDRMMPKLDGISLMRLLRSRKIEIPVIFLTALGKPLDIIEWLEVGAVEYLAKPVELKELGLRIKNLLTYASGRPKKGYINTTIAPSDPSESDETIHIHGLTVDFPAQKIMRNGQIIHLSPKEYNIFKLLLDNQWRVVTYQEIFEKVWLDYGSSFSEYTTTITVHIAYLRRKLGEVNFIRTVKLTGYIIDVE